MVDEDVIRGILLYLEKNGPTNTFRLSSVMGMDRYQLLNVLNKLEEKQAIRFEYGNAVFIKSISGEKPKPIEIQKISLPPEKAVRRKPAKSKALQFLQNENIELQLKLSKLKETVKELEQKAAAHPKTITKTVTKTVIKKVPIVKTVVKKKLKLPSFKMPSFTFLKNLKKIKEPEFVQEKSIKD